MDELHPILKGFSKELHRIYEGEEEHVKYKPGDIAIIALLGVLLISQIMIILVYSFDGTSGTKVISDSINMVGYTISEGVSSPDSAPWFLASLGLALIFLYIMVSDTIHNAI